MYTPFGEMWVEEASTVDISNITRFFTNQNLDKESGLYYYNARYYDPHLGSFITPDPAKANLNHYAYSSANPIKYTDPTGLATTYYDGSSLRTDDDEEEKKRQEEEKKKEEEKDGNNNRDNHNFPKGYDPKKTTASLSNAPKKHSSLKDTKGNKDLKITQKYIDKRISILLNKKIKSGSKSTSCFITAIIKALVYNYNIKNKSDIKASQVDSIILALHKKGQLGVSNSGKVFGKGAVGNLMNTGWSALKQKGTWVHRGSAAENLAKTKDNAQRINSYEWEGSPSGEHWMWSPGLNNSFYNSYNGTYINMNNSNPNDVSFIWLED